MSFLVDTDWVIDYLKGKQSAIILLSKLITKGLSISLISYGEILEGIYYGKNPHVYEQGFSLFLSQVPVLPLNKTIMKNFAHVRGALRQKGNIISDPDILIAATAIYYNLTLLTGNSAHFKRIQKLKLYKYSK